MAKWHLQHVTESGKTLLTKAQEGVRIQFTRVLVGDGSHYHEGQLVQTNRLISPMLEGEIKTIAVTGNNTVCVQAVISNENVSKGFFIRELALLATAEDAPELELVYCLAVPEEGKEDFWPALSGPALKSTLQLHIAVGNAEHVTANIINTYQASEIGYDNHHPDSSADNVQKALDELYGGFTGGAFDPEEIETRIAAHNESNSAHPLLRNTDSLLDARVSRLEDMILNNVSDNPFMVTFGNLTGVVVEGVWNEDYQRIEF